MAANETVPEVGDQVSWNWGGGAPAGKVAEVAQEGELVIETQRGNTVKKKADPENPAVRIERSGNDVVKRASEITVDSKANGSDGKGDKANGSSGTNKGKAIAVEGVSDEGEEAQDPEGTEDQGDEEDEEFDMDASGEGASGEDAEADTHEVNAPGKEVKKGGKNASKDKEAELEDQDAEGELVKDEGIASEEHADVPMPETEKQANGKKRKAASLSEIKNKEVLKEEGHTEKKVKHHSIS